MKFKRCFWKANENMGFEGQYSTQCGHGFFFTEDKGLEKTIKFCMFCGRKITTRKEVKI